MSSSIGKYGRSPRMLVLLFWCIGLTLTVSGDDGDDVRRPSTPVPTKPPAGLNGATGATGPMGPMGPAGPAGEPTEIEAAWRDQLDNLHTKMDAIDVHDEILRYCVLVEAVLIIAVLVAVIVLAVSVCRLKKAQSKMTKERFTPRVMSAILEENAYLRRRQNTYLAQRRTENHDQPIVYRTRYEGLGEHETNTGERPYSDLQSNAWPAADDVYLDIGYTQHHETTGERHGSTDNDSGNLRGDFTPLRRLPSLDSGMGEGRSTVSVRSGERSHDYLEVLR